MICAFGVIDLAFYQFAGVIGLSNSMMLVFLVYLILLPGDYLFFLKSLTVDATPIVSVSGGSMLWSKSAKFTPTKESATFSLEELLWLRLKR